MKVRAPLLALLAALALAGCATENEEPVACKGPAWSADASRPVPPIWDDGVRTYVQFGPNSRVPVPYVINPDKHEALADYQYNSQTHLMTLPTVAEEVRLRDGESVACFKNRQWAHHPQAGPPADTGTTSPFVQRVVDR